jgi:transcriptional regulator with XRE-family HTH domain
MNKSAAPHPRRRQHDAQLHAEGMATKASLSAALISLRERCGLTQVELCRRAGWKPQFVSRLEAPRGRMPDFATVVRYGKACGTSIGLLFATLSEGELSIVTAVTLQATDERTTFEYLSGCAVPDESSLNEQAAEPSARLQEDYENVGTSDRSWRPDHNRR